jgi:hypothetical protein
VAHRLTNRTMHSHFFKQSSRAKSCRPFSGQDAPSTRQAGRDGGYQSLSNSPPIHELSALGKVN